MRFTLRYGAHSTGVVHAMTQGAFGDESLLGFAIGDECTYFMPDTLTTNCPPVLDVASSGFTSLDSLHLTVKAPLVNGRSALNFSIGHCEAISVGISNSTCHIVYDVRFSWQQLFYNNCISTQSHVNGLMREHTIYLKVNYMETLPDMKRRGQQQEKSKQRATENKREDYRITEESLAFKVATPINVVVTCTPLYLGGNYSTDLSIRAAILSRIFNLQTHTATLVVISKVPLPGSLDNPQLSHVQAGLNLSISQMPESAVAMCDVNGSSPLCVQEWEISIQVDPLSGVCKLADVITIVWNTTCHSYPCSLTG